MKGINDIKIGFTTFVAAIASTAVLTVALTLCFTMTITALVVKKRARSLKSLQRLDFEKHQAAEIRVYEPITHHLKSECVTLENEVYVANGTVVCKQ